MDYPKRTFKELTEKLRRRSSRSPKSPTEKRQEKISKLQDNPNLWKFLEHMVDEDVSQMNKSYLKFRMIYQSGRRYSGKEWIQIISDLLDEIN